MDDLFHVRSNIPNTKPRANLGRSSLVSMFSTNSTVKPSFVISRLCCHSKWDDDYRVTKLSGTCINASLQKPIWSKNMCSATCQAQLTRNLVGSDPSNLTYALVVTCKNIQSFMGNNGTHVVFVGAVVFFYCCLVLLYVTARELVNQNPKNIRLKGWRAGWSVNDVGGHFIIPMLSSWLPTVCQTLHVLASQSGRYNSPMFHHSNFFTGQ